MVVKVDATIAIMSRNHSTPGFLRVAMKITGIVKLANNTKNNSFSNCPDMEKKHPKIGVSVSGTDLGSYGIGLYTRELLKSMAANLLGQGYQIHVFGTPRELQAYFPSEEVLPDGFVLEPLPVLCDKSIVSSIYHRFVLPSVASRLDVQLLVLPSGNRRVTSSRKVKTLAVVHDISQHFMGFKYGFLHEKHLEWVVLNTLKRIDKLVAVSRFTARDLEEVLDRKGEVVTIHNGAADRLVDVSDSEFRRQAEHKPYLLYPSRLEHPGKNHLNLLEGFARSGLKDRFSLFLSGEDWGAKQQIQDRITALGLSESVKLMGHMPEQQYNELFTCASGIACVGLREGFGLHALEAALMNKPVLASDTGAMQEFLKDYAVYCDPTDIDSIAQGLNQVCQIEPDQQFSDLYPDGYFTWERCGRELCNEVVTMMEH